MLEKLADYLGEIHKKPREARQRIARGGVLFCMVIAIFIWLWSLSDLLAVSGEPRKEAAGKNIGRELKQSIKDAPTLWESLGAGVSSVFNAVKGDVDDNGSGSVEQSFDLNEPVEKLPVENE